MRGRNLVLAVALVTATLTLVGPAGQASEASSCDPPVDVSLVLDRSGSMAGEPIETAREGASSLARNLTGNDKSGLVSYSTFPRLDQSLTFDHAATASAIESLSSDGSTATGDAIDLAHQDILDNARAGVPDVMVVLTDGITNTGSDPVVQAQEAKADGIEIFAIGLGPSVNAQDLRAIASDPTDEHFYHPQSTDELLDVFDVLTTQLGQASSGEAHALRAQVSSSTGDRVLVEPVAQATSPPDGETTIARESLTVGEYTVELGLVEDASRADVTPEEAQATSTARISSLEIANATRTLVSADTLQARSSSSATPTTATTSDDGTRLAGLEILGTPVEATVPPNTVVPVDEDTQLVLNEQITETTDDYASLRVNLVHLTAELPDGEALSLVVSSAASEAECDSDRSITTPAAAETPPLRYEGPDEEASVGQVTVNRGGCAQDTVAVSGSGCANGTVAASGFGPARSPLGVAASGTGSSQTTAGAALSAFGPATTDIGVAASGTDSAYTPLGAAASGTGSAVGIAAVSGTGDTQGLVLFSLTGECNRMDCYEVDPTGDADAWTLAVAGDGSAMTHVGASVAGTGKANNTLAGASVSGAGPAESPIGAAASGTGPAETGLGLAASGTNDAKGVAAVSGTGDTEGTVLFSATGECNGVDCYEVGPTGDADAWTLAVSGTDDSESVVGVAVSGTGDADTTTGAAISGCTGVQLELVVLSESAPSPVPVCAVP